MRPLWLIFAHAALALPSATPAQQAAPVDDLFRKGLVELQAQHFDDALKAFTALEAQYPEDARVHNFRGITLMSMNHIDEAAQEYQRATELDNQMEDAFRNLGFLEWTRHQNELAHKHLTQALKLAPTDSFAAYYLAKLEFTAGKVTGVAQLLQPFVTQSQPWSQLDLALTRLSAGQYSQAADLARTLLQQKDASAFARASAESVVGIAEAKLQHPQESIAAFESATRDDPTREEHWLNLSREQMDAKRLADAIASAREGLESNPMSYALHLRLAAAYLAAGKYEDAEKGFRELVAAGDPLPTSTIGLAQVLLRTGKAAEADTILAEGEHRLGAQFLIVYFEALALERMGERTAALDAYRRATQMNPNNAEAHFGVGKSLLALGDTKAAITELLQTLKLSPGNLPARRLLSRAHALSGDQANARKFAEPASSPDAEPADSGLVGDFILPEWQEPDSH